MHLSLLYGVRLRAPSSTPMQSVLHARLRAPEPFAMPSTQPTSPPRQVREPLVKKPSVLPVDNQPQPQAVEQSASLPPVLAKQSTRLEVPLIIDTTFYSVRELDIFPKSLEAVTPPFPQRASEEKISGIVTLELLIDETGRVREAKVLEATPAGYFEDAAVESFKAARFAPGEKDGKPVRCRLAIKVDFRFDPDGAEHLTRATR